MPVLLTFVYADNSSFLMHHPETTCVLMQVASGRFGVTPEFAVNADQLEIKIAQGAKPGVL